MPATDRGDNYISDLYRVVIETSDGQKRSVIVKCLPTAEYNLKFIRDACLFEKEILFYGETLQEMSDLLKIDNEPSITPKCLYIRDDSVLVFEDLLTLGYKIVDRRSGLDMEHCTWALKALARLHALSVSLPSEVLACKYPDTVYSGRDRAHAVNYIANSIELLAAKVEKWSGFERFGSKLREIAPGANDRIINLFECPSSFRVLNHGDVWVNNMMFRYDENKKVTGIKLLDFQMCRFVSPAFDLHYFFSTSLAENIRLYNLEQLVKEYHREFCRYVGLLGKAPVLTLDELKAELDKNAFFGLISACLMLPVVLSDPEDTPDLGTITTRETELECHSGFHFQHQFKNILLYFEEKGII
ncbi:uncharacterized protein [Anabrus simplex]|uniref:uncharacterized protein n=1 Tax=Anabrus simplex TaxID=316456 RepID=UPI0035A2B88E